MASILLVSPVIGMSRLRSSARFSGMLSVPELERDLVARLADVPGELLRGVVEPGAGAGDADGGHALAARIEDRRRHRRDVVAALAPVDREPGAADLGETAAQIRRPGDGAGGQAPEPLTDDAGDRIGAVREHGFAAGGGARPEIGVEPQRLQPLDDVDVQDVGLAQDYQRRCLAGEVAASC